jgi:uncharacterized protein YqhQ
MQILISPIVIYKICSMTISGHPKLLLLDNYIYIVALTSNLQRVSFYSIIKFF